MPAAIYTADLADAVLCGLRIGRSLYAICRDPGMPSERTVRSWVCQDRDGFAARYADARSAGGTAAAGLTRYSADVAARILDQLMEGRLLIDICDEPGMPAPRTVRQWAITDRDGFAARYDRARMLGAEAMSEQMIAIADDGDHDWITQRCEDGTTRQVLDHEHISRSRLRIEARGRWVARLLPKSCRQQPVAVGGEDDPNSWAALLKAIDGKSHPLVPSLARRRSEAEAGEAGPPPPSDKPGKP
jgi:hypothetical protein